MTKKHLVIALIFLFLILLNGTFALADNNSNQKFHENTPSNISENRNYEKQTTYLEEINTTLSDINNKTFLENLKEIAPSLFF
ncbi:MAG: hypothetical protein ACLFTH_03320, partial [Candidatus Woesearchaeota archaeon]